MEVERDRVDLQILRVRVRVRLRVTVSRSPDPASTHRADLAWNGQYAVIRQSSGSNTSRAATLQLVNHHLNLNLNLDPNRNSYGGPVLVQP